jgi:hypothetical protein
MHKSMGWLEGCCMALVATIGCSEDAGPQVSVDASVEPSTEAGARAARDGGKTLGASTRDAGSAVESASALRYRADVTPVTRIEDAIEGTFIPPYVSCQAPVSGGPGKGPDGQVCTNVAISGATEPGRYFPDYASCEVVLTQRPFWSRPPAGESKPDDPRLQDAAYLAELAWVTEQVEATGCVCCHDSEALGGRQAGQWDIRLGPLWLDSLSDSGLALFAGLADSSVLGAYVKEDNFGFDRSITGIPTDDSARMQKFMVDELARRDISEAEARAVPPFGGPIYANRVAEPGPCEAGEGVFDDGSVRWKGGAARYVYVTAQDSDNPGVPPNLDLPVGTLFRLDVLPNAAPLPSGILYGSTPDGSFQAFPESTPAAPLERDRTYHLTVLRDVGLPIASCLFEYPAKEAAPPPVTTRDAGVADAGGDAASGSPAAGGCVLAGGDALGFGAPCREDAECTCAADYCALMPGQSKGYCSKTGCDVTPSVCPTDYSCLDLSKFVAGQPAICTK